MAFNVGAAPAGILAKALTGNIFVEMNLAFMNEGDKDGYNAYKHDIKNVLRARSANPASVVSNTSKKAAFKRNLVIVESFESTEPRPFQACSYPLVELEMDVECVRHGAVHPRRVVHYSPFGASCPTKCKSVVR